MPLAPLKAHDRVKRGRRPVVLCICDGMGYGRVREADAVRAAYTPVLDMLHAKYPHTSLYAHGTYVGLPEDTDMGNSEVGHNCIGCGRVIAQGAKLINAALESGTIFASGSVWARAVEHVRAHGEKGALHLVGLFSDGNVHSHLAHLFALIRRAKTDGLKRVRLHLLFDGRDVGETTGPVYIEKLDELFRELNVDGFECRVASGGGRMTTTMDRYEADWAIVERGYLAHIHGVSVHGNYFGALKDAYETLRKKGAGAIDQNLEEFVIVDEKLRKPVGRVEDGDAVVLFNFRGDRALEFSEAMDAVAEAKTADFNHFRLDLDVDALVGAKKMSQDALKSTTTTIDGINGTNVTRPVPKNVFYAGMMLYDGDRGIPRQYLVNPPQIAETLDEHLIATGIGCYAVSETQKYGHVTYFFNGNRSGRFSETLDTYEEIASDKDIEFSKAPWMRAHEITRRAEVAIREGRQPFIRLNYPNPDMVGHCGDFEMARLAVECVDVCLGRLHRAVSDVGGCLIVIADHGNADEMFEIVKDSKGSSGSSLSLKRDSKTGNPVAKTSHSLNPVPCIIADTAVDDKTREYSAELRSGKGLSAVAATILELLGFQKPDNYDESVLKFQ